jgi:hypothetical protein
MNNLDSMLNATKTLLLSSVLRALLCSLFRSRCRT